MTKRLDLFDRAAAKYMANDRRQGQVGRTTGTDQHLPAAQGRPRISVGSREFAAADTLRRVKRSDFAGDRYTTPQLR
jgi:hypothetical protein